jgi:hypothetical protein
MAIVDRLMEHAGVIVSVTIALALFSVVRRKTGGPIRVGQAVKVLLLASAPVMALAVYIVSGSKHGALFYKAPKSCSVELSIVEETDSTFVARVSVSSKGGLWSGWGLSWVFQGGETVTEVSDGGGEVVRFENGRGLFTLGAGSMAGNLPRVSDDGSFTDVGQASRNWTGNWLSENRISGTWGSPASSAPKPMKFVLNDRACSATVSGGRYGNP